MSEKLLRFLLTELGLVRVRCFGKLNGEPCPMVYEVPIDQLGMAFADNKCPRCNQSYECSEGQSDNILKQFCTTVGILRRLCAKKKFFDVEFVLPDNDKPPISLQTR
jgi:hypothetical protein